MPSLQEILKETPLESTDEFVRRALLEQAGIPRDSIASLLATLAFAKNDVRSRPGPGGFQTSLSPQEENNFRTWLQKGNILFNPEDKTPDYDMRGWFKALLNHDPAASYKIDKSLNLLFPPEFLTPFSLDFGPKSIYYKP